MWRLVRVTSALFFSSKSDLPRSPSSNSNRSRRKSCQVRSCDTLIVWFTNSGHRLVPSLKLNVICSIPAQNAHLADGNVFSSTTLKCPETRRMLLKKLLNAPLARRGLTQFLRASGLSLHPMPLRRYIPCIQMLSTAFPRLHFHLTLPFLRAARQAFRVSRTRRALPLLPLRGPRLSPTFLKHAKTLLT